MNITSENQDLLKSENKIALNHLVWQFDGIHKQTDNLHI